MQLDQVPVEINGYKDVTIKTNIVLVPVYALGEKCAIGRHAISFKPALFREGKNVSDWLDVNGKPKLMTIEFYNGVAEVEANLADFITLPMLNVASKTRPIARLN